MMSGSLFCEVLIDEIARICMVCEALGEPPVLRICRPDTLPCNVLAKLFDTPAEISLESSDWTAKFSFFFSWVWPMAVTTTSPSTLASSFITILSDCCCPIFTFCCSIPTLEIVSMSPSLTSIENLPSRSVATPRWVPFTITVAPITGSLSVSEMMTPVTTRA